MIKPLKDRILVEIIKETATKGSLIFVDQKRGAPVRAKVLSVGNSELKEGDEILMPAHVGTNVPNEANLEWVILHEQQILGVFE